MQISNDKKIKKQIDTHGVRQVTIHPWTDDELVPPWQMRGLRWLMFHVEKEFRLKTCVEVTDDVRPLLCTPNSEQVVYAAKSWLLVSLSILEVTMR